MKKRALVGHERVDTRNFLFWLVVNPYLLKLLSRYILVSCRLHLNLYIKVTKILYYRLLSLD